MRVIETGDVSVPHETSFKLKDAINPNRTGRGIWRKCGCGVGWAEQKLGDASPLSSAPTFAVALGRTLGLRGRPFFVSIK